MNTAIRLLGALLLMLFLNLACPIDFMSETVVIIEVSEKSAEKEIDEELNKDLFSSMNLLNTNGGHLRSSIREEGMAFSSGYVQKIQTPPPERLV